MYFSKALSSIMYNNPKLRYFDPFYDTSAFVYNILDANLENSIENNPNLVQKVVNDISMRLLGNRKIVDTIKTTDRCLPNFAVNFLKNIKFIDEVDGLKLKEGIYMSVPLTGTFYVTIKKQRGAVFESILTFNKNSSYIKLFSLANIYGTEPYSIAFRSLDNSYGIALIYTQASEIRNVGSVFIVAFDSKGYYIDDASKYIDIAKFGA